MQARKTDEHTHRHPGPHSDKLQRRYSQLAQVVEVGIVTPLCWQCAIEPVA